MNQINERSDAFLITDVLLDIKSEGKSDTATNNGNHFPLLSILFIVHFRMNVRSIAMQ